MLIKYKKKPTIYKGTRKSDLMSSRFHSMCYTSSSKHTSGMVLCKEVNGGEYIVYNLHKVRRKTKRFSDAGKKLKKPVVTPGYWIAYVYTFSEHELEVLGVKLKQNTRNFELVKK